MRHPLSLRNAVDLLHERGTYVSHETVRFWWNRFGPIFAAVHSSIRNRFNSERHIHSRSNFKLNRSAALAEWRFPCTD